MKVQAGCLNPLGVAAWSFYPSIDAQSGQHQYVDKFARSRGFDLKGNRPNVHWTSLDITGQRPGWWDMHGTCKRNNTPYESSSLPTQGTYMPGAAECWLLLRRTDENCSQSALGCRRDRFCTQTPWIPLVFACFCRCMSRRAWFRDVLWCFLYFSARQGADVLFFFHRVILCHHAAAY